MREFSERVRTVGEDQALHLDTVDALVSRVQHLLPLARAADGEELAIDEGDKVVDWDATAGEHLCERGKLRRPRGEGALVDQMRKFGVDVLHHVAHSLADGRDAATRLFGESEKRVGASKAAQQKKHSFLSVENVSSSSPEPSWRIERVDNRRKIFHVKAEPAINIPRLVSIPAATSSLLALQTRNAELLRSNVLQQTLREWLTRL